MIIETTEGYVKLDAVAAWKTGQGGVVLTGATGNHLGVIEGKTNSTLLVSVRSWPRVSRCSNSKTGQRSEKKEPPSRGNQGALREETGTRR